MASVCCVQSLRICVEPARSCSCLPKRLLTWRVVGAIRLKRLGENLNKDVAELSEIGCEGWRKAEQVATLMLSGNGLHGLRPR